ncbi:MAG: hypothetical protein M3N98_16040 [Actinomycetota bacterium]|nr:hypothetical protein [Actinomycetota bacterium]
MSLTKTHHAYASIDERGTNRAMQAFFGARPHYLRYGSTPFVSASSVSVTQVAPIAFPGVPGGIPYMVELETPSVDLFPPDGPLPPPLVLGPGRLAINTVAIITLGCVTGSRDQHERPTVHPVETKLQVIAIGHPVSVFFSPGVGDVSFHVDQVLLPAVAPASLQAVLDCLLEMIVNAALSNFKLPFNLIDAGFFKLSLLAGPTIVDDRIEILGDIT